MKVVKMPIIVPSGFYCWEQFGKREICTHFSNECAISSCDLGFLNQKQTPDGVLKDPLCATLGKR